MKRKMKNYLAYLAIVSVLFTSCSDANEEVIPNQSIQRSELIFTAMSEDVTPHGDHFHGISNGVEKESITVKFDSNGHPEENGHLHLEADVVYKMQLKVYDFDNKEIQDEFIASREVANSYKAFLIGNKLHVNGEQNNQQGAIFYPRDLVYGNGESTNTSNKYELTGILSYFTIGEQNAKETQRLTFVLRKLADASTKEKIELKDLIRNDELIPFPGTDILKLKFEVHVGSH